jgi:hypothetical protein
MTIVYGTPDELGLAPGRISRFYREFWPKNTPLADERLYDYLYRQPTETGVPAESSTVALDLTSDTIVAAMAARARAFFLPDGQCLNGIEMSTWMVHPEYRSGGVGVKVLNVLKDRADFCLGASITPEARDIYMRLGFRWQPALRRFVYAPDWTRLPGFVRDANLAQRIARARTPELTPEVMIAAVNLGDFGGIDSIRGAASFDRRALALQWRFLRNPFFVYRAVRITSGDMSTVVIYRSEPVGESHVLRVVDIIGPLSALRFVPAGLQLVCADESAAAIDCFCSHVAASDAFAAAGWFVLPDDECIMDFPHLLAPPAARSPNSFSTVSWLSPRFRATLPASALFVTKQDCDMDRLAALPHG